MRKENLACIDDRDALVAVVDAVLAENPDMVASYLGGKQNAAKALMGACMAATKGKADPVLLRRLLTESLSKLS
jgi:aspartyl-tRNA(Asn)/glutamyl-tRNA(Gln) amidotransferase subunit B